MITFYFKLQYRRFIRLAKVNQMPILVGLALMLGLFVGISYVFFIKVPYASWCYTLFMVLGMIPLSKQRRINHLKQIFSPRHLWFIRCIEHLLMAIPLSIVLVSYGAYVEIGLVLILGLLGTFYVQKYHFSVRLPTPFKNRPFEFIIGFRKWLLLYVLGFLLTIVGIQVNNLNLTLVTLFIPYLLGLQFYNQAEPLAYVWIHALKPAQFLWHKLKIAWVQSLILGAPFAILALAFYPNDYLLILGIQLVGTIYIMAGLLGKYAFYPSEINIIQGFFIGLGVLFPPFMLFILPVFYLKAKSNLASIL